MTKVKGKLAHRITSYRAGYQPHERREIEEGLKSGKYLGVTCTNALELGINIGSLGAVIISGYPGTMISTWQQSGRAGRSNQKSLAILIAFENQLDQYFMNNPSFSLINLMKMQLLIYLIQFYKKLIYYVLLMS